MSLMRMFLFAVMPWFLGCVSWPAGAAPVHFTLMDMRDPGGMYDSAGHKDKPMVLEFYFNGCPYCDQNAPNVKALAAEWHGLNAQVLDISIDCDASDFDAWIRRHRPTWPVLKDCDGEALAQQLGVTSYPTTIVLDRNHVRVWSSVGVWSAAKKQKIRQLLAAPLTLE